MLKSNGKCTIIDTYTLQSETMTRNKSRCNDKMQHHRYLHHAALFIKMIIHNSMGDKAHSKLSGMGNIASLIHTGCIVPISIRVVDKKCMHGKVEWKMNKSWILTLRCNVQSSNHGDKEYVSVLNTECTRCIVKKH